MEFLLKCPFAETQSPQIMLKFKADVEKFADENPWVQMRSEGDRKDSAGVAGGSTLRWKLTVGMGMDNNSPATLLTIHTGSQESVYKTREKYLSRSFPACPDAKAPLTKDRAARKLLCGGGGDGMGARRRRGGGVQK